MSKPTNAVKDWLEANLPKSFVFLSEKLSADGLAVFSQEIAEVKSRLDAQEEGNKKVKEDFEAERTKNTDLTTQLKNLTTEKEGLSTKLAEAQATAEKYKKYKDFYTEKTTVGNKLPKGDASNQESKNSLPADHPMTIILNQAV